MERGRGGGGGTEDARDTKQGGVGRDIAYRVDWIGGVVCAVLLVQRIWQRGKGKGRRTKYE
jgi:hypothetical protein